jgi:hypothetical protein
MATSKDLVTIIDENKVQEFASKDVLKSFLNNEPPKQWIKKHPLNAKVDYLPIDKVELFLDIIFQEWKVEVLDLKQLAQSIACTVRLHYKHPVTGEWSFHDGVGAVPLKTDKGFTAADLAHIKSDAVATGAPAAKAFAIKDAADHIGKIFGRDLNRADTVKFVGVYDNGDEARRKEKLAKLNGEEDVK